MTDEIPTGTGAIPPAPDPDAPTAAPSAVPRSRSRLWLGVLVGGSLIALGIWAVSSQLPDWLRRGDETVAIAIDPESPTSDARRIQATLFYVSEDGTRLVPVTRDVLFGATPAEQARRIVEAQVQTPEGVVSAIPAGTTVRSVFLTENQEAYVDLGGTIVSGHTGGSLDEALAVYAIVNAVTTNLPDVTGVQILIAGKEVDTLAGHLDLRFPLAEAPEWIQKGQSDR